MAACRPDVLAAAKRALRRGTSATLAEAMAEERSLSRKLAAERGR
jgi:enoyl-CoA hydratase/carnithine racemase